MLTIKATIEFRVPEELEKQILSDMHNNSASERMISELTNRLEQNGSDNQNLAVPGTVKFENIAVNARGVPQP